MTEENDRDDATDEPSTNTPEGDAPHHETRPLGDGINPGDDVVTVSNDQGETRIKVWLDGDDATHMIDLPVGRAWWLGLALSESIPSEDEERLRDQFL